MSLTEEKITISNKEEAGRYGNKIDEEIGKLLGTLPIVDGVVTALSVDDAIDNLRIQLLRSIELDKTVQSFVQKAPNWLPATHAQLDLWFVVCDDIIRRVITGGSRQLTNTYETPKINSGLNFNLSMESFIELLYSEGKVVGDDIIVFAKYSLFQSVFPFNLVLVLEKGKNSPILPTVHTFFELRELLTRKISIDTYLKLPNGRATVAFDSTGFIHIEQDEHREFDKFVLRRLYSPRDLLCVPAIREWRSEFRSKAVKTLKNLSTKGDRNLEFLQEEFAEIERSYMTIPGFQETFEHRYGVTLYAFLKMIKNIQLLSYDKRHTVLKVPTHKFKKSIGKGAQIGTKQVKRFVDLFTFPRNVSYGTPALLYEWNGFIFTNFRRIHMGALFVVEDCFYDYCEANIKGEIFEGLVRDTIKKYDWHTVEENIEVNAEYMPRDLSLALFNKVKKRTDIDVLGRRKNALIVIECKEIKWDRLTRRKTRMINLFRKYEAETFYKVRWVASEYIKFLNMLSLEQRNSLNLFDSNPSVAIALLVSNIPVIDLDGTPITVTPTELEQILKDWNEMNLGRDFVSIELRDGTVKTEPLFRISLSVSPTS